MKRKVISFLIILICFLLQSTVFPQITFFSVKPNLLIIVTASFGFMRGKKEGMFVGFICGILMDIFWGGLLGFYALIYATRGYVNGFFKRMFYDEDIKLPLGMIAASELIYGLVVYICLFMLQGEFNFLYYLVHIILPELVYTILVTLVLYQIILQINRKLEAEEQRSASRFV